MTLNCSAGKGTGEGGGALIVTRLTWPKNAERIQDMYRFMIKGGVPGNIVKRTIIGKGKRNRKM